MKGGQSALKNVNQHTSRKYPLSLVIVYTFCSTLFRQKHREVCVRETHAHAHTHRHTQFLFHHKIMRSFLNQNQKTEIKQTRAFYCIAFREVYAYRWPTSPVVKKVNYLFVKWTILSFTGAVVPKMWNQFVQSAIQKWKSRSGALTKASENQQSCN